MEPDPIFVPCFMQYITAIGSEEANCERVEKLRCRPEFVDCVLKPFTGLGRGRECMPVCVREEERVFVFVCVCVCVCFREEGREREKERSGRKRKSD